MEQLVILLLIALIGLINWLVKKSAALREARKLEEGMAKTGESLRGNPPPKLSRPNPSRLPPPERSARVA